MDAAALKDSLARFDASQGPRMVGPDEGPYANLQSVGVRFMIHGEESGGGFSLVEHPIEPLTLCAPLHKHSREDEYSFVLEGRMGALLGDDTVHADEGDLVVKPRDQWHTFWNAGDEPCRILEIISPAGFEHFFHEFGDAVASGQQPDIERFTATYGIEFNFETLPAICAEHGLTHPLLDQTTPAG